MFFPAMGRIFQALALLLPLALFVGAAYVARHLFGQGQGKEGIALVLAALAALALCEGLMLKCWLLPLWGRTLGERLYGGSYTPDRDALVVCVERIRKEKNRDLLAHLARLVKADASRARGWLEWASLLENEFHDSKAALEILLEGAECMRQQEDKAMFLCRAAHLCGTRLQDERRAGELYAQAAERYPNTAFGRMAADRLPSK